jgi:hypothetical protein
MEILAEGHFRSDLDIGQFAYELQSLMRGEKAETHVFQSFESLLSQAKE